MQFRLHKAALTVALVTTLWIGAIGAVLATVTGYLLSQTADYDREVVDWHQWLGIATAAISCIWLLLYYRPQSRIIHLTISLIVFFLLLITGHLGGTLTHGEGYLSFGGADEDDTVAIVQRKPLPDVNEAVVYTDIVQPVLQARCYSCHGTTRQKGKLRLDEPALLLRGGKNGSVLAEPGGEEAELVRRLLLPLNDKKHMPPKNKTQLTAAETALIHWWVKSGASFDKKVKEVETPEKIKTTLQDLENPMSIAVVAEKPLEPVDAADPKALQALRERGVVILPVSAGSNYLTVNFVSVENASDADVAMLKPLQKQIITLKLADSRITDSAMQIIGSFRNLRTLYLERTPITDKGLARLASLKELQHLNLVGTNISTTGLLSLSTLPALKSMFLYQTAVAKSDWNKLQDSFPRVTLDSGGYQVPILVTDTSRIAPKK